MPLFFIWQGDPGTSGADGAPGKDGPRVSTQIGEKQNLSLCSMKQPFTSTYFFQKLLMIS